MKKILIFLSFTCLPILMSAQVVKDSVTVLTDAQIAFGTVTDTLNFYGIQTTWKKFRMDSIAKYTRVKLVGSRGDITITNSGDTWTINSAAVDSNKLATNAVATNRIADNAVTTVKILNAAVDSNKLATNAVATSRIADNAVTGVKILNSAVDSNKLASNSVTSAKIVTGAVGATQLASTTVSAGTYRNARLTVDEDGRLTAANSDTLAMIIACSDETTAITTGNGKVTFRAPFAMTVVGVRSNLNTASSSGTPTVDILEDTGSGFVAILGTKLSIDANELTSVTAASAATITDSTIANDSALRIDVTTAGTGAKGLKVTILYIRP